MPLPPGSHLGHYEITAQIGVGGMGEVYRATDTKLDRAVAIKVLPESFARDTDRVARFTREAKTLAALNHPNIAQVFGVEEQGATRALVMELVEGEDLSQVIARGPIAWADALPLARQIADALEAAHEQGIIHRDLKPANIKVRADGTVKVLDFGLAKAMLPDGTGATSGASALTLTSPAMTEMGMILGTAAYMAPEQARGRAVDKRADIWAFGVVLYEMLTGRRAFDGEDVSLTLSQVLQLEPDFDALPATISPTVRLYLRRCLHKDPRQRVGDIRDVRLALEGAFETVAAGLPVATPPSSMAARTLPLVVTAAVAVLITGLTGWLLRPAPEPGPISQFRHVLPEGQWLPGYGSFAVSPDGRSFVYVTGNKLYIRRLDELEARLIPGLEGETFMGTPMFSPDGQDVVFLTMDRVTRVPMDGGAPIAIAPLSLTGLPSGGSWGPDGRILWAQPEGIWSAPAGGGAPSLLIQARAGEWLGAPSLLPDLDTMLFTTRPEGTADWGSSATIVAQRISTGERTLLVEGGSDGRYLPTGHLVYAVGNDLMAIAFDVRRLAVGGRAVLVMPGVRRQGAVANYGVGSDGTLVYVPGTNFQTSTGHWRLVVSDRTGATTNLPLPSDRYGLVRVSPDGRRLAVEVEAPGDVHIAIYDLDGRTALRRLTFGGNDRYPVWSRDGQRITFQSDRDGDRAVFWQRADGTGPAERLTTPDQDTAHVPASWSPGDAVLLLSVVPAERPQLGALLTYTRAQGRVEPYGGIATATLGPSFSPDGRWILYASGGGTGADGARRVYVQPYPATGAKYEAPVPKGAILMAHPFWALDGSAIYFSSVPGRWAMVPITTQPAVTFGNPSEFPRRLPSLGPWAARGAEIMPDGRFVGRMTADEATGPESDGDSQEMHIVLNWVEDLKRVVPVK